MNRPPLLALDFYGSELVAALAVFDETTDTLRLRHTCRKSSHAFTGAFVRNIAQAEEELTDLLGEIGQYTSYPPSVIVGLRGNFLSFKQSSGFQSLTRAKRVTGRDIEEALQNSIPLSLPDTLEVVDILPQGYMIDGNVDITDPIGMTGSSLEINTFLSYALQTHLNTLSNVLSACQLTDYQFMPSVVAMGETLVNESERKSGTLLLDLRQNGTSALLYHKGLLMQGWELATGQESLAQAVADLLQNDVQTAREVLQNYEPGTDEIVDEVLADAQEKVLTEIKTELLQSLEFLRNPPSQAVWCGETAHKQHLPLLKKVFGVRRARVAAYDDLMTDCSADHPIYAGALALLCHAVTREQNQFNVAPAKKPNLLEGFLEKFGLSQLF